MLLLKVIQDEQSSLSRGSPTSTPASATHTTADSSTDFSMTWVNNSQINHICSFSSDATRELTILNKYQAVKSMFMWFSSVIPSSAPVERLFSTGAIILSKRRNGLNDDTFEKSLFLKPDNDFSKSFGRLYAHEFADRFLVSRSA